MTLTDKHLHALARLGAVARLKELDDEGAAIRKAFPGLTKAATPVAATPAPKPAKAKKKRNVSPEVRQAAAERMKAYWANKRAVQTATGAAAGATPVAAAKKARKRRGKRTKRA